MKERRQRGSRGTAGFTLVEMIVAGSLFGLIGYGLLRAVDMGSGSQRSVMRVASENSTLRRASSRLRDEMRDCSESSLTITPLEGGNHQLEFMLPIEAGGAPEWGVYDFSLGPDEEARNKANWKVRYTVAAAGAGPDPLERRLVRQLVDEAGVVQREEVVAKGLRSGEVDPPGFSVGQEGDMWVVTLTTVGHVSDGDGRGTVFHVRPRN